MTEPDPRLPASERDPDDVHTAGAEHVSPAQRLRALELDLGTACAQLVTAIRAARTGLADPIDAARLSQQVLETVTAERDGILVECVEAGTNPAELGRRLGLPPTVVAMAYAKRGRRG